jgi:ferric-dicitrate binding protein FerR (iron transport regulator)
LIQNTENLKMTSNFDQYEPKEYASHGGRDGDLSFSEIPNSLKRDRFELLSAYLDGEVTAPERRQVEDWLKTDPKMQGLYARMLKMQQGIRRLPTPAPAQTVEQTVQQVVSRIERKPKRVAFLSGAMAIAALFVGAVVSNLPRGEFAPQFATAPYSQQVVPSGGLMIALDRPIIDIPKATISSPNSSPRTFE